MHDDLITVEGMELSLFPEDKEKPMIWSQLWNSAFVLCNRLKELRDSGSHFSSILELGCGRGLCGLFASKTFQNAIVTMTDVNESCLKNVEKSILLNGLSRQCSTQKLNWYDPNTYPQSSDDGDATKYDLIIGSDILYLEKAVTVLPRLLNSIMKVGSLAIIVDPNRCFCEEDYLENFSGHSLSIQISTISNEEHLYHHVAEANVKCKVFKVLTITKLSNKKCL